jgi:hypothetical protein
MTKRRRYREELETGYHVAHDSNWAMAQHKGHSKAKGPFDKHKLPRKPRIQRHKAGVKRFMTIQRCPTCKIPFCCEEKHGTFSVWCGNAACPNVLASNGTEGATVMEAVDKLLDRLAEQHK